MGTFLFLTALVIVALLFIGFGFKLVSIEVLNLFMFRLGGWVKRMADGFVRAPLVGLVLGLTTYESGLYAHFNQLLAEDVKIPLNRASQMVLWNRVGQIFFVWILFQPLGVFLFFILALLGLMFVIERKIFPFMIAVLLGICIIKYGAYMLNFADEYLEKYNTAVMQVLQHNFQSITGASLGLGILVSLLFCSLAPALLVSVAAAEFLELTRSQGLWMLCGIFIGLSLYSAWIERASRGSMRAILKLRKHQEWALVAVFFILALIGGPWIPSPQNPTSFVASVGGITLLASLLFGWGLPVATSKDELLGRQYYSRYAFSSCYAGIKLFIHQLTKSIAPLTFYTSLLEKALYSRDNVGSDADKIHRTFKARFAELKYYIKKLKRNDDGTKAAAQVPIMDKMLDDLVGIEGNLYKKTIAMQSLEIPPEYEEKMVGVLDALTQAEDAVLMTYISLMENPTKEEVYLMRSITDALLERLKELDTGWKTFLGIEEDAFLSQNGEALHDFLKLYKADVTHIKNLAHHLQKWINFLPRYDPRQSRLQQA